MQMLCKYRSRDLDLLFQPLCGDRSTLFFLAGVLFDAVLPELINFYLLRFFIIWLIIVQGIMVKDTGRVTENVAIRFWDTFLSNGVEYVINPFLLKKLSTLAKPPKQ